VAKPIVASQETVNAANTAATQFAATAKNKEQFDANAAKLKKITIPVPGLKKDDFTIPGIADSRQMIKWIFSNKVGDISEPSQYGDKYIVAIITGESKAGLPASYLVKEEVEILFAMRKKR